MIRDQRDVLLSHHFQSVRKNGTLYRHQPIDAVKLLLTVEQPQPLGVDINTDNQHLTLREREVLRCLKQGKSQMETAYAMSIKDKTVSTHKRTAMRKLNFKRNHELYHWLLEDGLASLEKGM